MGIVLNSLVAVTSLLTVHIPHRITPPTFESPIEAVSYVMFDLDFTMFTREKFSLKRAYPHSTGQPMVVRPPSLATRAGHSISRRPALATTLDIAIPKGSANSPKRCAQK